jgi:O-antigen ligase
MTTRQLSNSEFTSPPVIPAVAERQYLGAAAIILVLCFALLAPGMNLGNDTLTIKAEVLLLPVLIAGYIWLLMAGRVQLIGFNGMFLVGALFCFCIALSLFYGFAVLGHPVILRDLYEIPKACLPVLFFTLGYEANLSENSLRRLFNYLAGGLFLVCIFAWAQFLRVPFTGHLNVLYSAGEHAEKTLRAINRVYSTMGNPNVLGQLMDWGIAAFLLALLFAEGNRVRNLLLLSSCFVTLAMTASRYGLLGALLDLILVLGLLLSASKNRNRVFHVVLLALSLPLFFLVFRMVETSTFGVSQRFEELRHPLQADSLRMRLDIVWHDAWTYVVASPWLGHGPAKQVFSDVVTDSEYLDILKQFGIIGFLSYLGYFLFPLGLTLRGLRAARSSDQALESGFAATLLTLRLAFIICVSALFMNIGESTLRNAPLQGFVWLWLGLGASAAQTIGRVCESKFLYPSTIGSRGMNPGFSPN